MCAHGIGTTSSQTPVKLAGFTNVSEINPELSAPRGVHDPPDGRGIVRIGLSDKSSRAEAKSDSPTGHGYK